VALHGVALVDKPAGMSSFSVVSRLRRIFRTLGVTKAGHTGTLDPLATGLLPICVGESTKFAQRLLDADKGYLATISLGTSTTTGDREGEITETRPADFDSYDVRAALAGFIGSIEQKPPIYSALKVAGKPAYEYARAGQVVELATRTVLIHSIDLLSCDVSAQEFVISVACSKGTYIRTLAEDLAIALGTVGHLASLRRTRTGGFDLSAAQALDAWMECDDATRSSWLLPSDSLVAELPRIALNEFEARDIQNGKVVSYDQTRSSLSPSAGDGLLLRVYGPSEHFLGLAKLASDGLLRAERLLSTNCV
jgi:tRNA pseudouridine55 synthase